MGRNCVPLKHWVTGSLTVDARYFSEIKSQSQLFKLLIIETT